MSILEHAEQEKDFKKLKAIGIYGIIFIGWLIFMYLAWKQNGGF